MSERTKPWGLRGEKIGVGVGFGYGFGFGFLSWPEPVTGFTRGSEHIVKKGVDRSGEDRWYFCFVFVFIFFLGAMTTAWGEAFNRAVAGFHEADFLLYRRT